MDEGPESGLVKLTTTGAFLGILNATEHSSEICVHKTGLFPDSFG